MGVIEKIGMFLDPIIVVRQDDGYWTPNGNHRLQALKKLGYRAVTALLVPDADVAFKILALNTEKAHNLREKSLETIRMARALAEQSDATGSELRVRVRAGAVSDARRRLRRHGRGSAAAPISRSSARPTTSSTSPIGKALKERERRGKRVLKLDEPSAPSSTS